jgi:hypothetical protein
MQLDGCQRAEGRHSLIGHRVRLTARAEGVTVEMTVDVIAPGKEPSIVPIKVQMTLDSARSLRAQLQPAITKAEVHQRR